MDANGSTERIRLNLLSALGDGLWELRRSGSCCDVMIVADGVTFKCHKVVLCAVSPYFTAMFTHDMKESRDSKVILHDMKADLFESLLESIYRGINIVNEDNVEDVMEIASMMQIGTILEQCESHLSGKLSVSSFIDIWYTAKKYSCTQLERIVWTFMLENFSSLCENEDLALLPFDTIVALLRDDNLNIKSEDIVCDAAIQWLNADLEHRQGQTAEILNSLRIPLCSSEYIIQNLSQNETFAAIQGSQEKVQEAYVYRMCPAKKHAYSAMHMTHRATSKQEDVLVIMGGADTSDYTGSGMRCYSFLKRKWYTLPSLPENVGSHYATCTYGDDIFVSGGQYHREGFYRFQASTCAWVSLIKMPTGRYHHAMVCVSDIIYTLGGEGVNSKTIEGYQINAVSWDTYGELLDPVSNAVATVCEQTVLLFGGNGEGSDSVQRFDTKTNQVTRIDTLKLPGLGARTVACGCVNYVIASDGHVVVTSYKKAGIIGKIENFHEQKFGVTQYRGSFYIITGTKVTCNTKQTDSSKIRVVSPKTLKIDETIAIPLTQGNLPWLCNGTRLACCRIAISKRYLQSKEIFMPQTQK